jgi:hypothetical protein
MRLCPAAHPPPASADSKGPAHVVIADGQHGGIGVGRRGQLPGSHGVQAAGAFAFACGDDLAGVARTERSQAY